MGKALLPPSQGAPDAPFPLLVLEQTTLLADSRAIAQRLAIEHRSFFRLITTYLQEMEADFGKVRFEIAASGKTHQPQKYALLTEDQTYAYLSYAQNTEAARTGKRLLVKAFAQARARLRDQTPSHTVSEAMRPRALENLRTVPQGYFSVMGELFKHIYHLEALINEALDAQAMLEISVGQHWSRYAREVLGITEQERRAYRHRCQDGRLVNAWAYPLRCVYEFATWLWDDDFPKHFRSYQQYRATHLRIAAPSQQCLEAPCPPDKGTKKR